MIALIAALDCSFAIGRDGAMPWHLPDDLRRFKRLTLGNAVLMGRKTAISIGRALPGRTNLVLSRHAAAPFPGQIAVRSIEAAQALTGERDLLVVGGGEVYAQTLDRAERMHLTWVDLKAEQADTFFPRFDTRVWQVEHDETHGADANHACAFRFVDYRRVAAG